MRHSPVGRTRALPFNPARELARQLGIALETDDDLRQVLTWGRYRAGTAVQPGPVLFPKLELADVVVL